MPTDQWRDLADVRSWIFGQAEHVRRRIEDVRERERTERMDDRWASTAEMLERRLVRLARSAAQLEATLSRRKGKP